MTEHTYFECKCHEPRCLYCDGGLATCTVCGGAEGSLTTDCPERQTTAEEQDEVYTSTLDFRDGQWCQKPPLIVTRF